MKAETEIGTCGGVDKGFMDRNWYRKEFKRLQDK